VSLLSYPGAATYLWSSNVPSTVPLAESPKTAADIRSIGGIPKRRIGISTPGRPSEGSEREKLIRTIRFTIGFDLQLEPKRVRNRLWKIFEVFPDEESARIYFEKLFWPNGPVCPRCKSGGHVGSGTNPYRCKACDRQFTVRVGTIFERSHIPLHQWFWAIVILASARRKVSSTKLAALIGISQPATSGMIRKLKDVWLEWSYALSETLYRDLTFADLSPISWKWPFFTGRPRSILKNSNSDYDLNEEEVLIGYLDTRSPEKEAEDEAVWKLKEQVRKAEDWTRRLQGGVKSAKRFLGFLVLWKKRQQAHVQDHLKWIPFKWMTRRDCPVCRFGESEWRHCEAIAIHFDLVLWEEFWDWIEDLERQATVPEESELEAENGSVLHIGQDECRIEVDRAQSYIAGANSGTGNQPDPDVVI
jgi:transposase-like protein